MLNSNYSIEKTIINRQRKYVFKGYFFTPSLGYFEDALKGISDDNQYSEIIFDVQETSNISAHCLAILHTTLSHLLNTKKIMIICKNNSQVERLFLYLGFAHWFTFINTKEVNEVNKPIIEDDIDSNIINTQQRVIKAA